MSGIKGSKSKFYIKEPLPGIENSSDTLVNVTTGELPGARIGLDVIQHGVFTVATGKIIGSGSAQRLIECVGHGAKQGDVMKVTSGNSVDAEIAIINVIDADNFVIAYEADLSIGDTFSVLRYVTVKYASDGSITVITTTAPTQYILDGVDQQVIEDTATSANNRAFPSKLFIEKDGQQLPVTKDTGTPANNVAIPVELVGTSGPINITAGDLNVQLTDLGANFDRTRVGDGTNQWNMNASNEGLVHDADVLAELQTINTNTTGLATEVTLDAVKTAVELVDDTIAIDGGAALSKFQTVGGHTGTNSHAWHVDASGNGRVDVRSSVLPTGAATDATLSAVNGKIPSGLSVVSTMLLVDGSGVTQPISATSLPLPTGAATDANQTTTNSRLGDLAETAPATDTASSGLNGRLQRIAQRITSLIALLPSSIGQKTKADSLSVTLASDQGAVTVNQSAMTPTSSDVTVNGTAGTATAPAGAKWCKIYASKNNTDDVVVRMGGTATTTVGTILEPARSEDFMVAGDVSHISVSGTQKIHITWGA